MTIFMLLAGCAPQRPPTGAPAPSPSPPPHRACEACRTDLARCQVRREVVIRSGDPYAECMADFMECMRVRGVEPGKCPSAD